jgi:hypothetical protein
LRADGFIIRAQATIRADGFFVRAGFAVHTRVAKSCALRAPTPSVVRIHTIRTTEGVLQKRRKRVLQRSSFRADGFIIRAQAMIRTDGFFVRAGLAVHTRVAKSCALRAPTPFFVWIQTIHTKNGVLQNSEPRKRFT